jgi:hypothetical protein
MTKYEILERDLEDANEMYQIAVLLDSDRQKQHSLKVMAAIEERLNS